MTLVWVWLGSRWQVRVSSPYSCSVTFLVTSHLAAPNPTGGYFDRSLAS